MFERIVENALEFLTKAIDSFQADPKHSIINFHTAVELFLKARLMREHWSLAVLRDADFEKFEAGDFISVSFEAACERLQRIVCSPVPLGAKKNFDAVRRHRNRIVHFSHEIDLKVAAVIETIAREQLRAWYDLNLLLTIQWKESFAQFGAQFAEIEQRLTGHREYLQAKFDGLRKAIENEKAAGTEFRQCKSCSFEAKRVESRLKLLYEGICLVCSHQDQWIDYTCGSCDRVAPLEEGGQFACQACGDEEFESQIVTTLNEFIATPDNYFDATVPANCGECDGHHTVVEYGGRFLCVTCFDISDALFACEFCGDHSSGTIEESYLSGCTACEGSIGWHRDRD